MTYSAPNKPANIWNFFGYTRNVLMRELNRGIHSLEFLCSNDAESIDSLADSHIHLARGQIARMDLDKSDIDPQGMYGAIIVSREDALAIYRKLSCTSFQRQRHEPTDDITALKNWTLSEKYKQAINRVMQEYELIVYRATKNNTMEDLLKGLGYKPMKNKRGAYQHQTGDISQSTRIKEPLHVELLRK